VKKYKMFVVKMSVLWPTLKTCSFIILDNLIYDWPLCLFFFQYFF